MMNLLNLLGKFHIHNSKMNNSKPCLKLIFSFQYIESLKCIDKKCSDTIVFAKEY